MPHNIAETGASKTEGKSLLADLVQIAAQAIREVASNATHDNPTPAQISQVVKEVVASPSARELPPPSNGNPLATNASLAPSVVEVERGPAVADPVTTPPPSSSPGPMSAAYQAAIAEPPSSSRMAESINAAIQPAIQLAADLPPNPSRPPRTLRTSPDEPPPEDNSQPSGGPLTQAVQDAADARALLPDLREAVEKTNENKREVRNEPRNEGRNERNDVTTLKPADPFSLQSLIAEIVKSRDRTTRDGEYEEPLVVGGIADLFGAMDPPRRPGSHPGWEPLGLAPPNDEGAIVPPEPKRPPNAPRGPGKPPAGNANGNLSLVTSGLGEMAKELVKLPFQLRAFGNALAETQPRLAPFSGMLPNARGPLDNGGIFRDARSSGTTADSTKMLADSQSRLEKNLLDLKAAIDNITDAFMSAGQEVILPALRNAAPWFIQLFDKCDVAQAAKRHFAKANEPEPTENETFDQLLNNVLKDPGRHGTGRYKNLPPQLRKKKRR